MEVSVRLSQLVADSARVSVLQVGYGRGFGRLHLHIVTPVRLLVLGAGGVGSAAARIAARRPFLTHVVLADYERARA